MDVVWGWWQAQTMYTYAPTVGDDFNTGHHTIERPDTPPASY